MRSIAAEGANVDTGVSMFVFEYAVGISSNLEPDTEFSAIWGGENFAVPFCPNRFAICELGLISRVVEERM